MNGVDESEFAGFVADGALDVLVAEEARRHARPEGKDDEGNQVAYGHGPSPGFVESRAGRATFYAADILTNLAFADAVAGGGKIV